MQPPTGGTGQRRVRGPGGAGRRPQRDSAPGDSPLREALGEFIRAAGLVRRIGVNLNQAVAKLNATGQRSGDLLPYAAESIRRAGSSTRPPRKSGSGSARDRQGRPARQRVDRPDLLPVRPGPQEEHTDPHLIAGWRHPAELEPPLRHDGRRDFRHLTGLLQQPHAALGDRAVAQPVWHCSVRAAPGDRMLSDDEWARSPATSCTAPAWRPYGQEDDAVRWVAVRHAADHIHMVAMLARQDGTRPRLWNDYYRVGEACRAAEDRFGLRRTAPRDRTAARRPTRRESEKAAAAGCRKLPGSRSAGRSAPPPPARPASRSSSPGWTGRASWSASGSAPATRRGHRIRGRPTRRHRPGG